MHLTNYLQINLPHHQLIPTNAENYTKINEQQNTVYISSPRIYSTYINSKNRRLFQLQIKSSSKISRESSMNELTKRISMLEGKFYELERKLFVTQTINWHLEWMIDLQVQNSYWPCLVTSGMVEPGNKSDDEKLVLHRPKKEIRFDEDTI